MNDELPGPRADAWLLVEVTGDTVRLTGSGGLTASLGEGDRTVDPGVVGPTEVPLNEADRMVLSVTSTAAPPTTPIAVDELAEIGESPARPLVSEPGSYPESLQTVKIDARVASVRPMPSSAPPSDGGENASAGQVRAALCPSGHVNPPGRKHCRVCQERVGSELVDIEPPILGRVVAPDGRSIPLLGKVLVGRSPSASAGEATLAVSSRLGDVSRTHVEVFTDGWTVYARDVSRNGTILRREGIAPTRLARDEPIALLSDDQLDLGDAVTLRIEDVP